MLILELFFSQGVINCWTNGNSCTLDNDTFYLLVENLKDVVFQIDQEGYWTYLNPAWEAVTGFSTEDALGSHFQGYVLPEDRKKITFLFKELKSQSKTTTQLVVRFISKTGKVIWVDFSVKYLADQDAFMGSLRDITVSMDNERRLRTINKKLVEGLQREQALTEEYQLLNEKLLENEEELRKKIDEISALNRKLSESEALLKHTSKVAKIGGWEIDLATLNIQLTEEFYHLIELPVASAVNLEKASNLLYPDDRSTLQAAIEQLISLGKEFATEVRVMTAKGKNIWMRVMGKRQEGPEKSTKVYGIFQDITDRKQALQEIEEYAILFNLSRDLIAIAGFNGYFLQLNPAWQETLGFSIEELRAQPFINFVHPEDREKTLEATKKLGETNREYIEFTNRYQCKDGTYRWIAWNAKSSVKHKKIYAISRNITDQIKNNF